LSLTRRRVLLVNLFDKGGAHVHGAVAVSDHVNATGHHLGGSIA